MGYFGKVITVFSIIIATFLIGNISTLAKEDQGSGTTGACYCCGGSQGCTYDWKEKNETVATNCSKVTNKTKTTCNGSSTAGACYCCGGSQGCTYDWKNSGETIGGNCSKIANKTEATCHGSDTASGTGACWLCDSTDYKWSDDGASPGTGCTYVSGMGKSACYGTPSDHNPGVGESSDNEYPDYEDPDGPDVGFISGDASCSGIIGSGNFHKYLTDILNAMRIVAVAMVIVFSTLDFGKALITQDNDAMKKASEKTTKRLALAIIIFFVPILLNILLGLVGLDGACI